MTRRLPPKDQEMHAKLGCEAYERFVQPTVRPEDHGKYAVIDVRSGDFEVDGDRMAATDRLRGRRPDGEFWLSRIGFSTVASLHGGSFKQ